MTNDHIEVRGLLPRYVVDVVDSVAIYKGVARIEVVRIVLKEWADEKLKEAALIARLAGNP